VKILVLAGRHVHELLGHRECADVMRQALTDLARGQIQQPLRTVVRPRDAAGFMGLMPAYSPGGYGLIARPGRRGPGRRQLPVREGHRPRRRYQRRFLTAPGRPFCVRAARPAPGPRPLACAPPARPLARAHLRARRPPGPGPRLTHPKSHQHPSGDSTRTSGWTALPALLGRAALSLIHGRARQGVLRYRGGTGMGITAVDLVLLMRTGQSPGAASRIAGPGGDVRSLGNVRPPGYHRQAIRLPLSRASREQRRSG
jgi:Ornithine cyclodeaminase/mu-crystallin family